MSKTFIIVDSDVLPDVFIKSIQAKKLLASGEAKSLSMAAKMVGISRSALYKYKDKVFECTETRNYIVSMTIVIKDVLGALQSLLKLISSYNISVVTVTQSAPSDGVAIVFLDLRVDTMTGDVELLLRDIRSQSFVVSANELIK